VKSGELVDGSASRAAQGQDSKSELLSSLTGGEAGRDRDVANKTRRVVLASLGVMQGQKAGRKRSRALALAAVLLVVLALGPFLWHVADELIGGELLSDIPAQTSLMVCILVMALLAAALIAGWRRK
jgi:hypothetical protein